MSAQITTAAPPKKHQPYVPPTMQMKEFTFRAVLIGMVMTAILGAANAYLGLKAGMTIAATYPAAVIGMAILRLMKGSLLEENIARTVGSIGESVAAGAVFTLPAFVLSGAWTSFGFHEAYWKSTALMLVGGALGILFVTLLRRVMVEDPELPFPAPSISPAYLGVGYIIGPRLAALNFAGGVVSWGLLVPLIIYILGPQLQTSLPAGSAGDLPRNVWFFVARPIAVGGMMVGAAWTLFRMRKSLGLGMKRAISDLKKPAGAHPATNRTERDLNGKVVFGGLFIAFLCMVLLYTYFSGLLSGGIVAALVMIVVGFFFAAVSGNLVGMIGSSNNPVSGLTLCTLIIAALLMVAIGFSGLSGVAAVLGVAAVVCVSSAVADDMLQDLKVGHILGGTPAMMQVGDFLGILVASAALYFPLLILHQGNINRGGIGFGDPQLSAPQAGLMASLAQGIVGGNMPWPLVGAGILMGFAMILLEVKSVMLFAVGMYLPL